MNTFMQLQEGDLFFKTQLLRLSPTLNSFIIHKAIRPMTSKKREYMSKDILFLLFPLIWLLGFVIAATVPKHIVKRQNDRFFREKNARAMAKWMDQFGEKGLSSFTRFLSGLDFESCYLEFLALAGSNSTKTLIETDLGHIAIAVNKNKNKTVFRSFTSGLVEKPVGVIEIYSGAPIYKLIYQSEQPEQVSRPVKPLGSLNAEMHMRIATEIEILSPLEINWLLNLVPEVRKQKDRSSHGRYSVNHLIDRKKHLNVFRVNETGKFYKWECSQDEILAFVEKNWERLISPEKPEDLLFFTMGEIVAISRESS